MSIRSLTNSVLVQELKSKVLEERKLLNEILELLYEVHSRRLHLEMAYSSLEDFCERELGYSRGSAYRRVESMKLLKSLPEENQTDIKSKIEDGSLNLTQLTTVHSFFKNEAKQNHQFYTAQEMTQIISSVENKSKMETQRELAKISPSSVPRQVEKIKFFSENDLEITLRTDPDFLDLLNKAKSLGSHLNPGMSSVDVIKEALAQQIKRLEPKPSKICSPASKKENQSISKEKLKIHVGLPRSRYIPRFVKHKVWQRDNGKCSYVNKQTGEVCQSRHFLQYDHIHEFSKGGLSTNPENIRLLCGAHNRFRNVGRNSTH